MNVFRITPFGRKILRVLKKLTIKKYHEILSYEGRDFETVSRAFGRVQRSEVLAKMTPYDDDILNCDALFRNFKACSHSYITGSIRNEQILDQCKRTKREQMTTL